VVEGREGITTIKFV